MLYTALGDSITFGYCSTQPERRYVSRLHSMLGMKQPLNLWVHAKPGWTSGRLLQSLSDLPEDLWEETLIATLMIGGNDLLRAIPFLWTGNPASLIRVSDKLYRNVTQILDRISKPHNVVVVGTLYNPFPNSKIAASCTEVLNNAIRSAAQRDGVEVAEVQNAFKPRAKQCIDGYRRGLMRDIRIIGNPIHPNDDGHQLIAKVFHQAYHKRQSSLVELRQNMP